MRKGMARVERDGRQYRKDVAAEVLGDVVVPLGRELRRREQPHARAVEVGEHVAEQRPVLPSSHLVAAVRHRRELLAGAQGVGPALLHMTGELLLEAGDADHEEFVEVRAGDGEELQPLQGGDARIEALLEHALVEGQPRELAIDEEARVVEVLDRRLRERNHGGVGWRHHREGGLR